jgi:4-diphosphocytidyl-2-C-methyl-D-erythritol kinase
MLTFPNCKINIGLHITNRREDGYHDLETIFYPVTQLKDALEIIPSQSQQPLADTRLTATGLKLGGTEKNNLVWKAFEMLQAGFPGKIPVLDICLHKAIPMGAGLGGGSADGAFMLKLLNEYCQLGLDKEELAHMALNLGSDCPFFIYNTPQFAMGRGEKMLPVSLDLSGYEIKIITPGIHVSTRDAFATIKPRSASFDLKKLSVSDIDNWKHYVVNDFEAPVFARHPQLQAVKDQLYNDGALYASMSGSGSALYGIFRKHPRLLE